MIDRWYPWYNLSPIGFANTCATALLLIVRRDLRKRLEQLEKEETPDSESIRAIQEHLRKLDAFLEGHNGQEG